MVLLEAFFYVKWVYIVDSGMHNRLTPNHKLTENFWKIKDIPTTYVSLSFS
jgi:hypothetical protein